MGSVPLIALYYDLKYKSKGLKILAKMCILCKSLKCYLHKYCLLYGLLSKVKSHGRVAYAWADLAIFCEFGIDAGAVNGDVWDCFTE